MEAESRQEKHLKRIIGKSQERVTGTVKVRLYKGAFTILARSSPNAPYSEDSVSFDSQNIDQKDAEGFAKYPGFQNSWIFSGLR
ncbi:MAG: argininosuccinate synthase [Methanosarcina sp.]|nr:argininosuccinate synthase [Methanosarcina sp.]